MVLDQAKAVLSQLSSFKYLRVFKTNFVNNTLKFW